MALGRTEARPAGALKSELMKFSAIVATCVVGVLLCACATVYEGKYSSDAGWRKGRIESIGLAPSLGKIGKSDCRQGASDKTLESQTYASVFYLVPRQPRERIVPVPPDSAFKAGDLVYVNIDQCDMAVVRRPAATAPVDAQPHSPG